MDKSVPAPAAKILDLIGSIEAPKGYNTVYGNNQAKLTKPLTSMTLKEVLDAQPSWTKNFGSSACGRYQFMRATLMDLAKQFDLKAEQIFTPDFQDWLGHKLLLRRKYPQWFAGQISTDDFMVELAKEWASFPVPKDMQGAHRRLTRGQSYYAGDGLNKALIDASKVWLALEAAKKTEPVIPPVPDVPKPIPVPTQEQIAAAITAILPNFIRDITAAVLAQLEKGDTPKLAAVGDIQQRSNTVSDYHSTDQKRSFVPAAIIGSLVPSIAAAVVEALVKNPQLPGVQEKNAPIAREEVERVITSEVSTKLDESQKPKPASQSKTIWGAVIAGLVGVAGAYGFTVAPDEQEALIATLTGIGTLGGAILAWVGRLRATRPIA